MYEKREKGSSYKLTFIFLDVVCLEAAFILAYMTRYCSVDFLGTSMRLALFCLLPLVDICFITFMGLFDNVMARGYWKELAVAVKHTLILLGTVVLFLFAFKLGEQMSRMVVFITAGYYLVLSYLVRIAAKKAINSGRNSSVNKRSLVVVTSRQLVEDILEKVRRNQYEGYVVTALYVEHSEQTELDELPVLHSEGGIYGIYS